MNAVGRWRRRLLGVVAATVLATGAAGLLAAPAQAHNSLRSTTPAADARLDRTPAEIVLSFDEPAIGMGTQILVTGPSGLVAEGVPRLVDNTVTQPLQPGAPAGRYVVDWRVTSIDGHPVTGSFSFTSAAAGIGKAPSTARPTSGEPTSDGPAGWVFAVVAVVAVVVVAVVASAVVRALRRGRRASRSRYDSSASATPVPESQDPQPQTDSATSTESRPTPDE